MSHLQRLVSDKRLHPALDSPAARQVAAQIGAMTRAEVYPDSLASREGVLFFLLRRGLAKQLGLVWARGGQPTIAQDFAGQVDTGQAGGLAVQYKVCPTTPANAAALRRHLSFTAPVRAGLRRSIGFGDRLGVAGPGHIRAVGSSGVFAVLAQQSIRELSRTQRTPQEVIDAATWGVFEAGWRDGFGADADHLKTIGDVEATLAAGFCMFTIDPSEHVDNAAQSDRPAVVQAKFERLPWSDLAATGRDYRRLYLGRSFQVGEGLELQFSEEQLVRAAVKYGGAVAHTARLAGYLSEHAGDNFELEMSVDETSRPTSVLEHFFVASELKRLGVRWISLAPRFVGEFEKAVDYKGDLGEFERQFAEHVQVARHLGPYKISIHSGSDKFSIYPIVARHAGELVHLKTAGTSYLEALRVVAMRDPALFREIFGFARGRFEQDKATYHISADVRRIADVQRVGDDELASLLDDGDSRQLLHVTFGSVLTWRSSDGRWLFRDRLLKTLAENEELHYDLLSRHLARHVGPFAQGPAS
ncbi:MAG: tagaturonate epimerase family protein, partial [Phycisphaerae bacterium]